MCVCIYIYIYIRISLSIYIYILEFYARQRRAIQQQQRKTASESEVANMCQDWIRTIRVWPGVYVFLWPHLGFMYLYWGGLRPPARGINEDIESTEESAPRWRPSAARQNTMMGSFVFLIGISSQGHIYQRRRSRECYQNSLKKLWTGCPNLCKIILNQPGAAEAYQEHPGEQKGFFLGPFWCQFGTRLEKIRMKRYSIYRDIHM
jgi:hypothetical protein